MLKPSKSCSDTNLAPIIPLSDIWTTFLFIKLLIEMGTLATDVFGSLSVKNHFKCKRVWTHSRKNVSLRERQNQGL